jgi:hypothetical protein
MSIFDEWEKEEAEKRRLQYEKDKQAVKEKAEKEKAKHDAGIGVEDGTEEFEEDEE